MFLLFDGWTVEKQQNIRVHSATCYYRNRPVDSEQSRCSTMCRTMIVVLLSEEFNFPIISFQFKSFRFLFHIYPFQQSIPRYPDTIAACSITGGDDRPPQQNQDRWVDKQQPEIGKRTDLVPVKGGCPEFSWTRKWETLRLVLPAWRGNNFEWLSWVERTSVTVK